MRNVDHMNNEGIMHDEWKEQNRYSLKVSWNYGEKKKM